MISFLKSLDWQLNIAAGLLIASGLLAISSAAPSFFLKHLFFVAVGLALFFIVAYLDFRPFINHRWFLLAFYLLTIALLIVVYFFAPPIRGVKAWLKFGSLNLQPAELVKLSLILLYAKFFSRRHIYIASLTNTVTSFVYFIIPGILLMLQPDLGSAVVIFFIWLSFLLTSGMKRRHLLVFALIALVFGFFLWNNAFYDYQKERILGFVFPEREPFGINWSQSQAKIAIGSAGLFGKGFKQGTQTQLGFLPEKQSDFIFAAAVEEFGLLFGLLLILSLAFLVLRLIKVALESNNNFTKFVCLGTSSLFLLQFLINLGSSLSLTPVIGTTLPLVSYGGSSFLTDMILLGIIQSSLVHRSP